MNARLPGNGTVALGGTCARKSTDNVDFGNDNCMKGLFCANTGQATTTTRTCHSLCTDNTDCSVAGEECLYFTAALAGVCTPRCNLFGGGGAACGPGQTCRVQSSFSGGTFVNDQACGFVGTVATGAACTGNTDCGAGQLCNPTSLKCTKYCNTANACASGQTCIGFKGTAATGFDASLGYCN